MSIDNRATVKLIEKKIPSSGRFTKTEAAALTGLSIDQVEPSLREMVIRYECRLQVTENGDLIYDFGKSLRRRGEKTLAEYFEEFWQWLWLIFTYAFKAWITVTLIVYCTIFLVLLIAMALKGSSDSDRDDGIGFDVLGHIFIAIFQWNTASDIIYYETDRYGYRYRQYRPKTATKKQEKGIIAAVYDFVFGPPRVKPDPLANHREAAAFIRRNMGILVTTELKALAGWNAYDAAAFFSECIARYQGDIKVSNNGIMYGEFEQLIRTISSAKDSDIVFYWDEYEPDYQLTGNSSTHNFIIICLNLFNLLISSLILLGVFPILAGWSLLLGWIPFVFSLLFFLIPLCRAIIVHSARAHQHWHNIRRRVMRAIFQMQGEPMSVDYVLREVNSPALQEERLERAVVEKMLEQLKAELPGDIIYSDDGQLLYAFPIIGMELKEAQQLRAEHYPDKSLGKVVFDSEK
ncbi:MAG: hypothetical protein AB1489_42080 [Acidobacteriota bacterium]